MTMRSRVLLPMVLSLAAVLTAVAWTSVRMTGSLGDSEAERSARMVAEGITHAVSEFGELGDMDALVHYEEQMRSMEGIVALRAFRGEATSREYGIREGAEPTDEAARNTQDLIDKAVERASAGSRAAEDLETSMEGAVSDIETTTGIIGQVTAASERQAGESDSVNESMTRVEKITQANAAGADEMASATQDLAAMAGDLETVAKDLVSLVEGDK